MDQGEISPGSAGTVEVSEPCPPINRKNDAENSFPTVSTPLAARLEVESGRGCANQIQNYATS